MLWTGVWGGLMALERRAFLQAMVSRPLVAATVTGLINHDLTAGLYVGLVFELLHLGGASLGGAQADHETLPAVAGAALAADMGETWGSDSTPAMWALAVLLAAPTGLLGRWLEKRLDERARRYYGRAQLAATEGLLARASRQNLRAMWPQFVFYGLLCTAAAAAGPWVAQLEHAMPLSLLRGLGWAYPAMAAVAAATAVHGSHARGRYVVAALSAGAVAAVAFVAWYGGHPP
jgi:mannose/fructose/N-acetylgalactosamine-specific phosphotransferase system component IIC